MSLLGTLAKVAIGVAVVKGVGGMLRNGLPGGSVGSGGSIGSVGADGRYGSDYSPGRRTTDLENIMKDVLGSAPAGGSGGPAPGTSGDPFGNPIDPVVVGQPSGGGGGLGGLLNQLGGAQGGLGQILGPVPWWPSRASGWPRGRGGRRCGIRRRVERLRRSAERSTWHWRRTRDPARARTRGGGRVDAARHDPGGQVRRADRCG